MTPKRLRLIALVIRKQHASDESWKAIAQEIEDHATELETIGWTGGEAPMIRLKEPRDTVFNDLLKNKRSTH